MVEKYKPISPKYPHILHGGDYNPDQWLETPEIIDEDIRLMKKAHVNVVSLGIFAWSKLEPEEGKFDFSWLDNIMDKLAKNGIYVILATPSGARPIWLAKKYPEVLRVDDERQRQLYGGRHNHCLTSPIYREKVRIINTKLAERYKDHPALIAWHISNEYSGECHCPLCQEAFRQFLKDKYGTLEKLNHEWWTSFWSHSITDWSQIESPSKKGEFNLHGLKLDWKRFITHQTVDFFKNEIGPIRRITPNIPVTTNFMGLCPEYDQWEMAKVEDIVSWDNYPEWHNDYQKTWETAAATAFSHDLNRSLKGGRPFMMMESAPGNINWRNINKLQRPGIIELQSMQAVAHGSDTVQYFQWRKGRGGFEKFHGAVVGHSGSENTRIFSEVSKVGEDLEKLDAVVGTTVKPEVAVVFDYQNLWAIEDARISNCESMNYTKTCIEHYTPFWKKGVPVDVINEMADLSGYKLVIAPMAYMLREGFAERIDKFVKGGGTFVTTYLSGFVNDNDLCWLGGFPGPLRKILGIWDEEQDALYPSDKNSIVLNEGNELGFKGSFDIKDMCDIIHAEKAQVLAIYKSDFYKGKPALTVNNYGKGHAYYIAARTGTDFLDKFYSSIIEKFGIKKTIDSELPEGVSAEYRTDGENDFVFIMNFTEETKTVKITDQYKNMLDGNPESETIQIPAYGFKLLQRNAK
ncbi:MAG: beta-galactosidase [[Clostridium] cellulosi]